MRTNNTHKMMSADSSKAGLRVGVGITASLLIGLCACAGPSGNDGARPEEDAAAAFSRLKKLYDGQDYPRCVTESSRVIADLRRNNVGQTAPSAVVKNIYDLKASCQQLTGDDQGAIDTMRQLTAYPSLTNDERANAEFRLACVYERAGQLSKALAQFGAVASRWRQEFPDSFAKMADDRRVDLMTRVAAAITGRVVLPCAEKPESCSLVVFNGTEDAEGEIGQDGAFSIPLFSSTTGTMFTLFVLRGGRKPFALTRRYEGGGKVELGEIRPPETPAKTDSCFLCGTVFNFASGGERVARRGITSFAKAAKITTRPAGEGTAVECVTDDDGVYTLEVPPGAYVVTFSSISKTTAAIAPGETVILNFPDKRQMVD